jgi:hypothetical protein
MHYFTVNATSYENGELACDNIRDRLERVYGKKVALVKDSIIGPDYQQNPELFKKLTCPDSCNNVKVMALLEERERLYHEQLMPCLSECEIVLYHGGMLYDTFWMDAREDSFPVILRENVEFLQSIGGVAYPAGAIIVLGEEDEPSDISHFKTRSYQVGNCMSRYKSMTYAIGKQTDLEPLLTP